MFRAPCRQHPFIKWLMLHIKECSSINELSESFSRSSQIQADVELILLELDRLFMAV